jgi:CUG-BP- and ETR3-like factor
MSMPIIENETFSLHNKMFVGDIPIKLSQSDLMTIFAAFGPIYDLSIMWNHLKLENTGCCFVTYFSSESLTDAKYAINNKLIFTSPLSIAIKVEENHPDSILFPLYQYETKIFVGMLSRNINEDCVKELFQKFGPISKVIVLRDGMKVSKGCAFINYLNNSSALQAISVMHRSQIMKNCSFPINVKFANISQKIEKNNFVSELYQSQQKDGLNSLAIFQNLINNLNNQIKLNNNGSQFSFQANKNLKDSYSMNFDDSRNSNTARQIKSPSNSNIFIYHLPVSIF